MINLIPPRAKKALLVEYWVRAISVWLILWSSALLMGAFLLIPVQVLISSQTSVYEQSAVVASENVLNYENVSSHFVRSSQQARLAIDEKELPVLSSYVELFEDMEGREIEINRISLSRSDLTMNPIVISGVADNRQALASFRDRIVLRKEFSEVDLPISNLAQDKDISFTITIMLNKQDI